MRESGCNIISFGAQSADSEILRRINRDPHEPEELSRAIYQAKSMGITTAVAYIFGLPGETEETLLKNLTFCLKTKPHIVDFHQLEIIPFSELNTKYENKKISKFNESQLVHFSTKYMISYYLRPNTSYLLLKDILNKNPLRIFTFGQFGFYFLKNFCEHKC